MAGWWRRACAAAAVCALALSPAAATDAASRPPVRASAFGIHVLGLGDHPVPGLRAGTARIWDMGVTWADLQPTATTPLDGTNPVVQRLDRVVATYRSSGIRPLLVLGMTPAWAADPGCHPPAPHSTRTCGPVVVAGSSTAWAAYVRFLVTRYPHVDLELWNEPNLRLGWNDTLAKLATLQRIAHDVVGRFGTDAALTSPGVAMSFGDPLHWLPAYLSQPGSRSFDAVALHLYPSDSSARNGTGPEWTVGMLRSVRGILAQHDVHRPVWDTETNVGRYQRRTTTSRAFPGASGAAMVARTYLLRLEYDVTRTYWYAADDRSWGGTWLEQSDFRTLTAAGLAYRTLRGLVVGARPTGCRVAAPRWSCGFRLADGRTLRAVWTTGTSYRMRLPAGVRTVVTATGARQHPAPGSSVSVTHVPLYLVA